VCLQYSRLYRRARGMFFSLEVRTDIAARICSLLTALSILQYARIGATCTL
jgi:hypothetical protein